MDAPLSRFTRRDALKTAAAALTASAGLATTSNAAETGRLVTKGRLNQSVCKWCYPKISLDEMCSAAQKMGLVGIDLLTPKDFPTLKKYGLVCTMTSSHPLQDGLCDPKFHDASIKAIHAA